MEDLRYYPQVYTTQESIEEIKRNTEVYTIYLFWLKVEATTVNPYNYFSYTSFQVSLSSTAILDW